jgi:hypothetical protein
MMKFIVASSGRQLMWPPVWRAASARVQGAPSG